MASWSDSSASRTRYVIRFEYHRTSHPARFTVNSFASLFFAVDRAADLLLLKTAEILDFPKNLGLIMNHLWVRTGV